MLLSLVNKTFIGLQSLFFSEFRLRGQGSRVNCDEMRRVTRWRYCNFVKHVTEEKWKYKPPLGVFCLNALIDSVTLIVLACQSTD